MDHLLVYSFHACPTDSGVWTAGSSVGWCIGIEILPDVTHLKYLDLKDLRLVVDLEGRPIVGVQ